MMRARHSNRASIAKKRTTATVRQSSNKTLVFSSFYQVVLFFILGGEKQFSRHGAFVKNGTLSTTSNPHPENREPHVGLCLDPLLFSSLLTCRVRLVMTDCVLFSCSRLAQQRTPRTPRTPDNRRAGHAPHLHGERRPNSREPRDVDDRHALNWPSQAACRSR